MPKSFLVRKIFGLEDDSDVEEQKPRPFLREEKEVETKGKSAETKL